MDISQEYRGVIEPLHPNTQQTTRSMEDLARFTPDNPLRFEIPRLVCTEAKSGQSVQFVTPCLGDACLGSRIEYVGDDGQWGMEILCPAHQDRWFAAQLEADYQKRLQHSRIPEGYRNWTFDTWEARWREMGGSGRVLSDVLAWLTRTSHTGKLQGSIRIQGDPGNMKTGLGVAICQHELRQGNEVFYITEQDSLSELRYGTQDNSLLRKIQNVPLLMWDDLAKGREQATPRVQEILFSVIDSRYANGRATIITTNATPSQLAYYVGDAGIYDRLQDIDRYWGISLTGESKRPKPHDPHKESDVSG